MSTKRICLNCGGEIPQERQAGTKYCKDSCKARYHERKLMKNLLGSDIQKTILLPEKKEPVNKVLPGLEGVIQKKVHPELSDENKSSTAQPELKSNEENSSSKSVQYGEKDVQYVKIDEKNETAMLPELVPVTVQVETEAYKKVKGLLNDVRKERDRLKAMIKACDEQIEKINKGKDFSLLPLTTAGVGGVLGYNSLGKKILPTAGGALFGYGAGKLLDNLLFADERKLNAERAIVAIKANKAKWMNHVADLTDTISIAEQGIPTMKRYETKTEMQPNPLLMLRGLKSKKNEENSNKTKLLPELLNGLKQNAEAVEKSNSIPLEENYPDIETNGRIMSSKAFREMTYPAITFQNKWENFFGEPSTTFHLVVHGKPGEGKSTFCIQFAYYLAKHHGNTIYISGEEGFSKTLQLKVNMMNADHPRLFFTDLKSFDEITAEIQSDKFHFIFMDSLDTLGVNAEKMRELKKLYPASAFITISQSTKDGKMRGSQEIIHDADIEVYIRNGIAVTNKNRFKEKGKEFQVFQQIKAKSKEDKTNSVGSIL